MENWLDLVATAISGSGITALGMKFWLDRKKQDYEQRLGEEKQATETLQGELARMGLRIDKLEAAHADCMKGHIEEARKSGMLEGRIVELSNKSDRQEAVITQQNVTIAKLQSDLESYTKTVAVVPK